MTDQKERAEEQVKRKQYADQLLSNPLFVEYKQVHQLELFSRFISTKVGDIKEREELWRQANEFDRFMRNFERVIDTGKMAEQELQRLNRNKR